MDTEELELDTVAGSEGSSRSKRKECAISEEKYKGR